MHRCAQLTSKPGSGPCRWNRSKPRLHHISVPGVFRARTWYRVALVVFCGIIAAPLLVMGLLYLTGLLVVLGLEPFGGLRERVAA